MLKDVKWSPNRDYKTGSKFEPIQFYLEALSESSTFDLMLGYFSSAAINVLSFGFAKFLSSGGKMRIIINDVLSENDRDVINRVENGFIYQIPFDLNNFGELKSRLDDYDTHFFQCMGWLIQNNRIEIKAIRPLGKNGISHYKCGVFSDPDYKVGFSGSCNFTPYGLLQNLERLDLFLEWDDLRSKKWIENQVADFDEIFSGNADHIEYLDSDKIKVAIATHFGNCDVDELLIQEAKLIETKKLVIVNKNLKERLEISQSEIEEEISRPHYPTGFIRRDYQIEAYNNWKRNNYSGLFAMATGTGKTVTSLSCILEEYFINNYYQFFVLVPTIDLAIQWENEIVNNFSFTQTILCSSRNNYWEDSIREFGLSLKLNREVDFCIIVTYASFRSKRFQKLLQEFFAGNFNKMTLIADEAHTFGSQNLLNLLPHKMGCKIGLSATPERAYDEIGDKELSAFFKSSPPHTFEYNMKEAIDNNVLCKYYYYPVQVSLNQGELIEYKKLTKKLTKYIDNATGKYIDDPVVNNLLIQRKNIIHKSKNKKQALLNIIEEIGSDKFNKAFVYVPEGYESNYEETDELEIDSDDIRIIDDYTATLYDKYKFKMRKFTGDTSDREEILKNFSSGKLDALLAMKCLDEGVDVPSTRIAIFCSSTGNPRQYIQRRGRVLRNFPGKEFAYIYDMIVIPPLDPTNNDLKQLSTEKNIVLGELKRLVNFAVLAENTSEVLIQLEELALNYNIDIFELGNLEQKKYTKNEKS